MHGVGSAAASDYDLPFTQLFRYTRLVSFGCLNGCRIAFNRLVVAKIAPVVVRAVLRDACPRHINWDRGVYPFKHMILPVRRFKCLAGQLCQSRAAGKRLFADELQ